MNAYQSTCKHEAAHAAMCILLGAPVRSVDALGDATALGRTTHDLGDTNADHRTRMKVILAGLIESADTIDTIPSWPLDTNAGTTDERNVAELAKALDLTPAGYTAIVDDTLELWQSPEYQRVHAAISHALELHGQLDRHALARIKALTKRDTMQRKQLAVVDTTEVGEGEMIALAPHGNSTRSATK